MKSFQRALRQGGFSLVELMVALTLSLLLMAGALSILYSSKLTNVENERLARLQESGRTALELLMKDIRSAGYMGCTRQINPGDFGNGLSNATSLLWNYAEPAAGFNATGATWSPALDVSIPADSTQGSDVLVLRAVRQSAPVFRTTSAFNVANADIQVERAPGTSVAPNTPMIISSCERATVFMATAFTPGAGTAATISHAIGDGTTGNATANLDRTGFPTGALVMPIQAILYYVRNSADPAVGPTLWQRVGNGPAQELIQGVENLQVTYGVDTNNDLLVDDYVDASAVTSWASVVSINLAMLIRSPDEAGVETDTRTYDLLGQVVGPFNDRRLRTVFTTTVVLRNRTS